MPAFTHFTMSRVQSILLILCLGRFEPGDFRYSAIAASPSSASAGVALELRYRFEEEQPVGTTVGNVARDANLARLYDPEVLRLLSFRFLKQQPPASTEFVIDSTTGVIRSAGRVDRETLCPTASISGSGLPSSSSGDSPPSAGNVGGCDLRLDVAVQPLPYFRIIRVIISIVDVNDNAPRFATDRMSIEVLESTPVGATVLVPQATDVDGPEFGVQSYRLVSDSDRFILTSGSPSDSAGSEVRLVLTKPLDRELVDKYQLRIVSVDGGFPPKSGFVDVDVSVTDVNDNSPVFDQESYEASIPENVPVGTTFLRVAAVDYDLGPNGEVTYSLSPHSATSHGHLFGVDSTTGEVSVKGPIDYEEGAVHRLTVIARDRGGVFGGGESPGSATVPVVIHVIDLNDNAPTVSVDTLSSTPGAAEIAENSPISSFVAHLSVADRDSGNNGRFACSLDGGGQNDGSSSFRLTPMFGSSEEFQIVTAAEFDRERRHRYEVTVVCRDFGTEPMTSSAQVVVHVTDQNDNDPIFDRAAYIGELIENNYVGAVVLQVNATDDDLGDNADIRYSIAPGDPASAWFDIEPVTGVITAGVSFDRETTDVVRFRVVARDRGLPARSSTTHVTVAILDVNDERPTFSHPGYAFAVSENRPAGTQVGQVVARDRDGSIYGELSYYLVAPSSSSSSSASQSSPTSNRGADAAPFEIDPKTGTLTTTRSLDREYAGGGEPLYHLVVGANDRGVPPLSGTVNVTIYVTDENDNRPTFIFPTASNRTVHVSARTPLNRIITNLQAEDPDVGKNARILYSIESISSGGDVTHDADVDGSDDNRNPFFDIDAISGSVVVNRDLLEADGLTFELRVVASDGGVPPQSARETLLVVVNRTLAFVVPETDSANNERQFGGHSAFKVLVGSRNFIVIVALSAISFAIAIALIIAIIVVRSQDRRDVAHRGNEKSISGSGAGVAATSNKYNCRTETIKMLRAHQQSSGGKDELLPKPETAARGHMGSASSVGVAMTTTVVASPVADDGTLLMRHVTRGGGSQSPICDNPDAVASMQMQRNDHQMSMERSGQSWPSAIGHEVLQNPEACCSLLTDSSSGVNSSCCGGNATYHQVRARYADVHDPALCGREAEVNRLLKVLQQSDAIIPAPSAAVDTDSDHSGEGSNTDSGRGTSEVETDNGRMSKAPPIANGNEYRDPMPPPPPPYYDPRLRQQFPTQYRTNAVMSPDSSVAGSQMVPDLSYAGSSHTYSPSGRGPTHHLSTFSVSNVPPGNGVLGRPSTPPTTAMANGQPYFTSGRPYVNDLSAASLDRRQLAQYNPATAVAAARYAANACIDMPADACRSATSAGYLPGRGGYYPAPASPGTARRYPVAVRTPQLNGTGCPGNGGYYANGTADESSMYAASSDSTTSGVGQYSCADMSDALRDGSDDQTNLSERTAMLNDSSSVNPEELCNEIDKLFFKA